MKNITFIHVYQFSPFKVQLIPVQKTAVISGQGKELIRQRAKVDLTYKAYTGFANRFIKWLESKTQPAAWNLRYDL